MAKRTTNFTCQNCGSSFGKWAGQCDSCGEWNTLVEEKGAEAVPKGLGKARGNTIEFVGLDGTSKEAPRLVSKVKEFDRVCGGGLVPGSAILVGGDPGIGKSTLLLQVVGMLSTSADCIYVSGEESVDQVRMRARRLGLGDKEVSLASATNVRDLITTLEKKPKAGVVVIDSIQTMFVDSLDSAPGTVAQVRTSAQELIRVAKRRGFSLLLVGHVTKEGAIAGPRVLEHMVDTVLYFEGDRGHQFRILRGIKNRFGPTDEIGVFEMTESGLMEVENPSALFLAQRRGDVSGATVFPGIEGSRPVLVEIQALVAPSALGTPRRAVVGWDSGRLSMVLAVLEARCGVSFAGKDVYLNVAGGLRVSEPAADLAVAAALISAENDESMPSDSVVFGEIGLSGEVRPVGQADLRLKEAHKLGFSRAYTPGWDRKKKPRADIGMRSNEIEHVGDLIDLLSTNKSGSGKQAGAA
ncbi:MAG: DNA repair protein RadA [Alphaproteobacteria bacterium]|nr:DNA repair protein RadA [Alphaproteobacteria bacterium]